MSLLPTFRLPGGQVCIPGVGGRKELDVQYHSLSDLLPANRQFLISQITALSVKETLDEYVDDVTVKWPNDIYWRDRKICGMLIENDLSGRELYCSVLGIGININQREFLSDAPNPVSLTQITGLEYDREEILNKFRKRLCETLCRLDPGERGRYPE